MTPHMLLLLALLLGAANVRAQWTYDWAAKGPPSSPSAGAAPVFGRGRGNPPGAPPNPPLDAVNHLSTEGAVVTASSDYP